MAVKFEDDVLRALRRITRAIDLHSRHLATTHGLTVHLLVWLRVIGSRGPMSRLTLNKIVRMMDGESAPLLTSESVIAGSSGTGVAAPADAHPAPVAITSAALKARRNR